MPQFTNTSQETCQNKLGKGGCCCAVTTELLTVEKIYSGYGARYYPLELVKTKTELSQNWTSSGGHKHYWKWMLMLLCFCWTEEKATVCQLIHHSKLFRKVIIW